MRTKGMTEALRIMGQVQELANRIYKIHQECYNAGAKEEVSDMYYDMYARLNRVCCDLTDYDCFLRTGKHFCGYGITHGLDETTLQPLDLTDIH